mgnify:CR=1 FL=1
MNIEDRINLIDHMLLQTICSDLVNGTLLTQEDDDTLEMLLIHMWEDPADYKKLGVVIGES